jgi:hypothetical protein
MLLFETFIPNRPFRLSGLNKLMLFLTAYCTFLFPLVSLYVNSGKISNIA